MNRSLQAGRRTPVMRDEQANKVGEAKARSIAVPATQDKPSERAVFLLAFREVDKNSRGGEFEPQFAGRQKNAGYEGRASKQGRRSKSVANLCPCQLR